MKGKFITIEGGEGAGKTTNILAMKAWLEDQGESVVVTREPGGTPLAEELRTLVLSTDGEVVSPITELLIMFASRSQHIEHVIKPALERGDWVLCDRFTDATYAYQGFGRGMSLDHIALLENLVQGDLRPDLTVVFDIEPSLGLSRAGARGDLDRIEQEKLTFFESVRTGYLKLASAAPRRYKVVDAGQAMNQVKNAALDILNCFYHNS